MRNLRILCYFSCLNEKYSIYSKKAILDNNHENLLNILGKLAVIFIFSLAVYLLYHKLKAYSFNEIKIAVNAISPKALIFSFLFDGDEFHCAYGV